MSYYLLVGTKTEEQHNCNQTHQSSNHYLDISLIKPRPFREKNTQNKINNIFFTYRGYYTVARRYEFYFRVAKHFCDEKIKFISSSRRVMFFLLYTQKDIDKIIEGNYRNYVIDKLTCEITENKPLGYRM